jgi:hypothetical protein
MVNAFADSAIFVQSLPVWYKHRTNKFYPAFCFGFSAFLMRMPWLFVESWSWTLLVSACCLCGWLHVAVVVALHCSRWCHSDSDNANATARCLGGHAGWKSPWPVVHGSLTPRTLRAHTALWSRVFACPQVYFCVGFVRSARLLAFWAVLFTLSTWALTMWLAAAALMRNVAAATAIEVTKWWLLLEGAACLSCSSACRMIRPLLD